MCACICARWVCDECCFLLRQIAFFMLFPNVDRVFWCVSSLKCIHSTQRRRRHQTSATEEAAAAAPPPPKNRVPPTYSAECKELWRGVWWWWTNAAKHWSSIYIIIIALRWMEAISQCLYVCVGGVYIKCLARLKIDVCVCVCVLAQFIFWSRRLQRVFP